MTKKNTQPEAEKALPTTQTKGENAVALLAPEVLAPDWGAIEDTETTDLQVPKIFHQQAMSKFVSNGLARPGDFCDSLTGEILCDKENKLEVIIFGSYKTMVITTLDPMANRWKLKEIVTITKETAKYWAEKPLTESTEEGDFRYTLQYNYYCLLPSKINELPFVLTLGSTKTKVAKKLNTLIFKLAQLRRPGASVVFELASIPEKNERGSWFGLEVTQGRDTEAQELLRAHAWYLKSMSQKFVVVDEQDNSDDESAINI